MEQLDYQEKVWGGILGVIAILATLVEMLVNGISVASIAGAVKDISGTLIVVVLLITFLKQLPKKAKNFREVFEVEMKEVERKYSPLVKKATVRDTAKESTKNKLEKTIRYEIAAKISPLFGSECKQYIRLFDVMDTEPTQITFFIRETFFGNTETFPYNPDIIAKDIKSNLERNFKEYLTKTSVKANEAEIIVDFKKPLSTNEDAKELVALIDTVTLLFIAKNKMS